MNNIAPRVFEQFNTSVGANIQQPPTQSMDTPAKTEQSQEKNTSKKNLCKPAIIIGAAIGIAAGVFMGIKHGKAKLSDIRFDKGIANKKGKKFSGVIKDTLKNGDKIKLKYENGVIQHSEKFKDGKSVLEKIYDYDAKTGASAVNIFKNGELKSVYFKKNGPKESVGRLFDVLENSNMRQKKEIVSTADKVRMYSYVPEIGLDYACFSKKGGMKDILHFDSLFGSVPFSRHITDNTTNDWLDIKKIDAALENKAASIGKKFI